ncbi:MAG: N-acetylmuramoyl-L-alanine amidase [Thermodesulfovibrionia bacterium]|nr:N-acetylmuramoyl-L-alanine amidase [Thermodesulfovibrionia bacterium]
MLKFPIMKKALLLLSLFFFASYADADDLNILKLRSSRHSDFQRIVLEGPEGLIAKSIVSQRANNIHVAFPGSAFEISEQNVDVKYKKLDDAILFSPGNFTAFKAFILKDPDRLVIDVSQEIVAKVSNEKGVSHKSKTVVIDPGHGGPDYGIVKGGFNEKNVVLDIAKRINLLALENKLRSSLTRSGDNFISVSDRVNAADSEDADVFISLHVGNHKEIVLYLPVVTEIPAENILPYLAHRGQYDYQAKTNALLEAIQNSLSEKFSSDMIIVRHLPYNILSNVEAAAIMVELPSFEDASYINEFEAEIAGAIYRGITNYEENAKR